MLQGSTQAGTALLMDGGCYGYTFEYVIPDNLPPSYKALDSNGYIITLGTHNSCWGRVHHRLTASVDNEVPDYHINFDMKYEFI